MDRIFVKPATGMKVRKPTGPHLAAEGEVVNKDSYWLRRIADKDVEELPLPVEAAAEPDYKADKPKSTSK